MRGEVGLVAHAQPQIPVVSESPGEGGRGEGGRDNKDGESEKTHTKKYQH